MQGATTAVWVYTCIFILGILHVLYTSNGLRRAMTFWKLVGRMIIHYKLVTSCIATRMAACRLSTSGTPHGTTHALPASSTDM